MRLSAPASNGLQTVLKLQIVGDQMYFDAGGFPGRTVGLEQLTNGKRVAKPQRRAPMRRQS